MKFTDPIAQVQIIDMDKKDRVWDLTSPYTPWVNSVSIVWNGAMVVNSISIGIDVPYDYAIELLGPDSPFKQKNVVRARIGYATGQWTEWAYGTLSSGGYGLAMSPDGMSGSLNITQIAMKPGGYTLSKDMLIKAANNAEFLVKSIADSLGYEVKISTDASEHLKKWELTGKDKESYKTKEDYIGGFAGKDMLGALKSICQMAGCTFFYQVEKNKQYINFHTLKDISNGLLMSDITEMNHYVIRGILDESRNQYPLYSFTPDSGYDAYSWTVQDTAAASGVEAVGQSKETGEDIATTVKPEDTDVAQDGVVNSKKPEDIGIDTELYAKVFADIYKQDGRPATFMSCPVMPGGEEMFKQMATNFGRAGNAGLIMDINTIGIPWEKTGNLIQVHGAGFLYDDTYRVEKVTHSWTPGVWDMTLNVKRQGIRSGAGQKVEARGGQMPK
jgi:hypothetical protein